MDQSGTFDAFTSWFVMAEKVRLFGARTLVIGGWYAMLQHSVGQELSAVRGRGRHHTWLVSVDHRPPALFSARRTHSSSFEAGRLRIVRGCEVSLDSAKTRFDAPRKDSLVVLAWLWPPTSRNSYIHLTMFKRWR